MGKIIERVRARQDIASKNKNTQVTTACVLAAIGEAQYQLEAEAAVRRLAGMQNTYPFSSLNALHARGVGSSCAPFTPIYQPGAISTPSKKKPWWRFW